MNRLLDTIDELGDATNGLDGEVEPPHRFAADARRGVAAARAAISARRDQDDRLGDRLSPRLLLAGRAGARPQGPDPPRRRVVVASPGLYVMGLPFLRRRKSTLIDGAGDDARDLSDHLASYLHGQALRSVA